MREKWFVRAFPVDLPVGRFACIIERLRGAPARAEEKARAASHEALRRRLGATWSAQENIGHLTDLEELHLGRLDDFGASAAVLRAADLENRKTWEADHNGKPIERVLEEFRTARTHFIARLEAWEPARMDVRSLHPRLKVSMRVIDLAYFVAEHDDYHLARVGEVLGVRE